MHHTVGIGGVGGRARRRAGRDVEPAHAGLALADCFAPTLKAQDFEAKVAAFEREWDEALDLETTARAALDQLVATRSK